MSRSAEKIPSFQAYSEFKDFLENVKKVACRIGRHASRCVSSHVQISSDALYTELSVIGLKFQFIHTLAETVCISGLDLFGDKR